MTQDSGRLSKSTRPSGTYSGSDPRGIATAGASRSRPDTSAGQHHQAPGSTSRGPRFVLAIDRDGISVSLMHGRRLALWLGAARRRFGLIEVFTPREDWL